MAHVQPARAILTLVIFLVLPCFVCAQETILGITEVAGEYDTGKALVPCGDFNNDGKDDIIIVSTFSSTNFHDVVRIYSDDGTILATHNLPNGTYLTKLVALGDVDGDATIDYAYSTGGGLFNTTMGPMTTTFVGSSATPEVKVISGATGAVIRTHTSPSSVTWNRFGGSLENLGDIDGDGVNDLGTSDADNGTNGLVGNGSVFVYSGANGTLLLQVDGTLSGEAFGHGLSRAGDIDGDGTPELLVTVMGDQATNSSTALGPDRGVLVSGATGAVLNTFNMPANSTTFWIGTFDARSGEDIDGDGTNDIVLSRSSDATTAPNSGRIRMISGATGILIQEFFGDPCQGIGAGIDLADINGDGSADIISGNQSDTPNVQNEATVISGLTNEVMVQGAAGATDVMKVARAGDFNGDGYEDFMLTYVTGGTTIPGFISLPGYTRHVTVVAGGPALGSTAKSMVGSGMGGTIEDVLRVDFKTGGQLHCVGCDMGASITFSIDQPSMNTTPADFLIFGRIGVPMGNETYPVPGVNGDMTMVPAPMATWAIPMVFTLASSVGPMPGGEVFQTGPAPWSYTMVGGINFPMEFTLEGVIMQDATTAAKTNAVIVRVN